MKNLDFTHLEIPNPIKPNTVLTNSGTESKRIIGIRKMILKNKLLLNVLKRINSIYIGCENLRKGELQNMESISLLETDKHDAQNFESGYGYTDELSELIVTIKYQTQIEQGLADSPSESGKLYTYLDSRLSEILTNNVDTLLNFGVSYAYIDSILALKYPQCKFIGIDRSSFTQLHNQQCFGHIPNMEFLAGDIFDLLKQRKFNNGVFFTTRTLCLLPKTFVQKLYKAAADAGFQYIVGVEQIGISRQTEKAYQFSIEDQSSVLFRGPMYIHNYPYLLQEAGFEVTETELVKTNHPHEDYRFISFTGTRK